MKLRKDERERRMRLMAKAKVEMLLGLYVWPDGRSPVRPNGSPNLSNRELLRLGGYSQLYKHPATTIFAEPYFLAQVKAEMARRETRANTLAPYNPIRVQSIRDLFFDELETRLRHEPTSFSEAQLIAGAEKFELLAREREHGAAPPPGQDMMNQFNAFISRTVNVMSGSEKESLANSSAEAASQRVTLIKKLIDEANIVEADADDCDIIDAEIDPE